MSVYYFFFFNDTATTEIYTLSLHDALPIFANCATRTPGRLLNSRPTTTGVPSDLFPEKPSRLQQRDRKSTRLNSSHANISYAVFCLKKKKKHLTDYPALLVYHHSVPIYLIS